MKQINKKLLQFLSFSILLLSLVTLSSCGDDDKDEPNDALQIVGNYRYDIGGAHYTLTLKNNGRYIETEAFDSETEIDKWEGSYTLKDDILTMIPDYYIPDDKDSEDIEIYKVLSITPTTLVLRYIEADYEEEYTRIWTRY